MEKRPRMAASDIHFYFHKKSAVLFLNSLLWWFWHFCMFRVVCLLWGGFFLCCTSLFMWPSFLGTCLKFVNKVFPKSLVWHVCSYDVHIVHYWQYAVEDNRSEDNKKVFAFTICELSLCPFHSFLLIRLFSGCVYLYASFCCIASIKGTLGKKMF